MQPTPEYQIYKNVSAFLKTYPTKSRLISYDTPRKVRIPGFELCHNNKMLHSTPSHDSLDDSIRRTKRTISDIVLCNNFDLFCTFTFDPKKVDRNDPEKCKKVMAKWLNRQQTTHGKFDYIIVPEWHKKGTALHFHALLKNYNGKLSPATTKTKQQRPIYNIKSYRSGFSTAVPIDNTPKVSSYIKKYITKDMPMFQNKKRYWCSTGLIRPIITPDPQIDPFTLQEYKETYKNNGLTISERSGILPLSHN